MRIGFAHECQRESAEFAKAGSNVQQTVHNLETVYIRKKYFSPSRIFNDEERLTPKSLTGVGDKDGDWKFRLKAGVVRNTLRVDWSVGRDLHALYRYRTNTK